MDWLSFSLGVIATFALIGIGLFVTALVMAIRKVAMEKKR